MNTQSIKHNIEIIANVGVLLGIILLAYEVNQNNQLLAAESRATHMLIRGDEFRQRASDEGLMKLRLKFLENGNLSQDELWRLESDASSLFTKWEWEFEQYLDGALEAIPIRGYVQDISRFPHLLTTWQNSGNTAFTPDFVAFMEENVISQLE